MNIKEALTQLNALGIDAILFAIDDQSRLKGSLTDGDIRRGLINGLNIEDRVEDFVNTNPKFIKKEQYDIDEIIRLRENYIKVLPVIDKNGCIINIVNFRYFRSYLPMDVVIMAGGKGSRLKPMTNTIPKPLLKIGDKPIVEHNIDRLRSFGVDDFWISVRHLGEQIENYFGNGRQKGIQITYVWEKEPLGTIGAVSKIKDFKHEYILITNSDILTTLDYEDFFLDFLARDADMSVVTIPYSVDIPYAVLETDTNQVKSFREKPTYTYQSNGGIYLLKRELIAAVPENTFYNSTDLMQELISLNYNVVSYPIRQYWLDIGKPDDFAKAQEDIKHLDL